MMTPEVIAHLHASAFEGQGRAWSIEEFATLLESTHTVHVGDDRCFALGRVIVDEAELLTIATAPTYRRRGLACAALSAFEHAAHARGAAQVFLEVSEDNPAAHRLYVSAGYDQTARRAGYYHMPDGRTVDALILRKSLL